MAPRGREPRAGERLPHALADRGAVVILVDRTLFVPRAALQAPCTERLVALALVRRLQVTVVHRDAQVVRLFLWDRPVREAFGNGSEASARV